MPAAVGIQGEQYLWRDGTTSSLAPPSGTLDQILSQPTQMVVDPSTTAIDFSKIYREQPFIGGPIRFLAGQIARLPLKSYIRPDGEDRQLDRDSLFAQALRRPAPRRSRHAFKRDIALDLLVNANHLEEIVRANGRLYLKRILWRHAKPLLNDARTEVMGWEVWDQGPDAKPRVLSNFDVIHFALGNVDGPLGVSPLAMLQVSVRVDRLAQAHQLATLQNGTRLGVLIKIDPEAKRKVPGIEESVRQEFMARFGGPGGSGKPYVAGGVDVATIPQQTLVEAELIKQRMIGREEAAAVLQLSTMFIGDPSAMTQNNFSEAYRQLFKTTLVEPMDNIVETLDAHLLAEHPDVAPEGAFAEFDASASLYGDPLERAKAYNEFLACGALTIDEIRALENRPQFGEEWAQTAMLGVNNLKPAASEFAAATAASTGGSSTGAP